MTPCTILYAEDEPDDVLFLKRALKSAGLPHTLNAVHDGEEALEYLAGEGPFTDRAQYPLPDLILLDINMPKLSGLDVLARLRTQPHLKLVPVLILTSSSRSEDRERARELGADDYLLKPSDPLKLPELAKSLHDHWLSQ